MRLSAWYMGYSTTMAAAVIRIARFGLWATVGTFAVLGLVTAGATVVVLTALAFVMGGVGAVAWSKRSAPRPAVSAAAAAATVVAGAAGAAVGMLALAGLIGSAGVGVFAAAPALVALAVWVRRRHHRRPGPTAPTTTEPTALPTASLTALSNTELARRWERSYVDLVAARDVATLDRLCTERRHQLDEIERRNPVGFRRWIRSGNWVRGDSAPFLGS